VQVFVAQGFYDGEAVHTRQQAIDDDRFRPARTRLVQPFDAACGPIDVKAAVAELGPDLVGRLLVVLDEQHFGHRFMPKRPDRRTPSSLASPRRPRLLAGLLPILQQQQGEFPFLGITSWRRPQGSAASL